MADLMKIRSFSLFLLNLSLLTALSNCAAPLSPPPNPVASQPRNSATASRQPLFYDFPDIPIPSEMTRQAADCHVYQSGQSKAGLQVFRGRVELASLFQFFQLGLPHHGWAPKGEFHHHESLLIFEKAGKTCIISLYNDLFSAYAKIWVIPTRTTP